MPLAPAELVVFDAADHDSLDLPAFAEAVQFVLDAFQSEPPTPTA